MSALTSRHELLRHGFTVIPEALSSSEAALARWAIGEGSGVMVNGVSDTIAIYPSTPMVADLIQRGAKILDAMGLPEIKYASAAAIPKHTNEGPRPWHVDWWAWDRPEAWREIPPQVGVLFYLDAAVKASGHLTVRPFSHRCQSAGRLDQLGRFDETDVDVCDIVLPHGDAVVLDSRTQHAVTRNRGADVRICCTIWYAVDWSRLDRQVRATFRTGLPLDGAERLPGWLWPPLDTDAEPIAHLKQPYFPITIERITAMRDERTDHEIVAEILLPDDVPLTGGNNHFSWYRAIAAALAPATIAEFGVGRGYTSRAFLTGANAVGRRPSMIGWDLELRQADRVHAGLEFAMTRLFSANTRDLNVAPEHLRAFDLVHVDGDRTMPGFQHELQLAGALRSPAGAILVSGIGAHPPMERMCNAFAQSQQLTAMTIPSTQGMVLIR